MNSTTQTSTSNRAANNRAANNRAANNRAANNRAANNTQNKHGLSTKTDTRAGCFIRNCPRPG